MKKLFIISVCFMFLTSVAIAGPGHDHGAPGESAGGPLDEIELTEAMIKNLGVQTSQATLQDVARTIDLNGNVEYLPERQAIISSKAEGSVAQIFVNSGERVNKGDPVLEIQPRLVGNPVITLAAPLSGFVIEQNIVQGEAVSPEEILMRIADISQVLVRGQAFEDLQQAGIRAGQKVTVTTPSFAGVLFQGTVQRVDATLSAGSRARGIIALVDNPQGQLLANMQAMLAVQTGDQNMALVVPQRAILGDLGNYFLYVREDNHFYRRDLVLGQKFGSLREIIEGVLPDEHVVTIGNYQLQFVTPPKDGGAEDDHGHDH